MATITRRSGPDLSMDDPRIIWPVYFGGNRREPRNSKELIGPFAWETRGYEVTMKDEQKKSPVYAVMSPASIDCRFCFSTLNGAVEQAKKLAREENKRFIVFKSVSEYEPAGVTETLHSDE